MIRIWFKWLDLKTPLLAGFEAPDDTGGAPPVAQCDSVDLQGGHACFQEMFSLVSIVATCSAPDATGNTAWISCHKCLKDQSLGL